MKPTILFLCPHSATKSVLAAAYCQRLAAEYGLDLEASFAGTEPDEQIAPAVANLLQAEGIDVSHYSPRLVTREALAAAWRVISLGCEVSHLVPPETSLESWNDIPPPSQALPEARELIYARVEQLVGELLTVSQGSQSL